NFFYRLSHFSSMFMCSFKRKNISSKLTLQPFYSTTTKSVRTSNIDLTDAVTALKVIAGAEADALSVSYVSGDNKIGTGEIIYILRYLVTQEG
ncbi:hypothetical protein QUF80_23380, partial [Desulfococcaceae bacterium HSG8]|nr:hypothetical protein [Desulfococcaceae bacterium HSG8]